jgi:hypothetical protein
VGRVLLEQLEFKAMLGQLELRVFKEDKDRLELLELELLARLASKVSKDRRAQQEWEIKAQRERLGLLEVRGGLQEQELMQFSF